MVWDLVRLSDPRRVQHRVVTFFPNGSPLPFVYAERLRELGAYGDLNDPSETKTRPSPSERVRSDGGPKTTPQHMSSTITSEPGVTHSVFEVLRKPAGAILDQLPAAWQRGTVSTWNRLLTSASKVWSWLRWKAWIHVPPTSRILREYFRFRPDVVHAHGFYGFRYGLFFKKLFHRPMVHSVPCLISQMIHEANCPWMPRLYERYNQSVDRIFIAGGYRDELLGLGVPEEKLSNIQGLIDLRAIDQLKSTRARHRAEVRQQLNIPANSTVALSVGRLHPVKGHMYSVAAMPLILERIPDLHLVILGEGSEQTELEAQADELGVRRHIHFLGFVPEPLPFYAAADIYFRTPIYEGENLSSYPAIALGLPVVGFDTSCENDLIGKIGHGVLVTNKDAPAFAAAVVSILTLPDRGQAMGRRGIDYCYEHLDIKREVETCTSTYASLAKGLG
jgi:glycosyltransferase involved in cell wall biosynthesis